MRHILQRIRNFYLDVRMGVWNLVRWAPTIWRSRDFDQFYIYDILEQKLRFHSEYLRKSQLVVGWDEDVANIDRCIHLISMIKDDRFSDDSIERLEEKWGPLSLETKDLGDGTFRLEFKRPLVETDEDREQEMKDRIKEYQRCDFEMKEARYELFYILRRQMDRWWD